MRQKIRNCFDLPNDERSFQRKKAFQGDAFSFFFFHIISTTCSKALAAFGISYLIIN